MSGIFSSLPDLARRDVLRIAGLGAVSLGATTLLSACGLKGTTDVVSSDVLKIGLVSPQTGPLASFAAPDKFVIQHVADALRNGFTAGGKTRKIEIIVKDTQSSPTRATEVTKQLINSDGVDIVVASGTPDTANPVADQCEASGVPNVTTVVPWQAWYYGRGGQPGAQTFKYTTNFYIGMGEMSETFIAMMDRIGVDSRAAASLWPDDTDGNAFRDGFGAALRDAGYDPIDGGKYQNGTADFSPQIAQFKSAGAELFNGIPIPPDFQTFWKQAAQQNFKPKLATIAKSMLFPSEAEALGELARNIAVCTWWTPTFPYESSIDGTTAAELSTAFTASTGQQWSQALGSLYSLFEVCIEAFKLSDDPKDKEEVAFQLHNVKYRGMSGPLDFTSGPEYGVAVQKSAGGQWRPGTDFPWDLVVVDNTYLPDIPLGGDLERTNA